MKLAKGGDYDLVRSTLGFSEQRLGEDAARFAMRQRLKPAIEAVGLVLARLEAVS